MGMQGLQGVAHTAATADGRNPPDCSMDSSFAFLYVFNIEALR